MFYRKYYPPKIEIVNANSIKQDAEAGKVNGKLSTVESYAYTRFNLLHFIFIYFNLITSITFEYLLPRTELYFMFVIII